MSISISKILFNQRTFTVFNKCCRLSSTQLPSKNPQENVKSRGNASLFFMEKERQYCRNFMNVQTTLPVKWEALEEGLTEMKTESIRSTILRTCEILIKGDLAIDYCQYLINKGETLSMVDICLLLKILAISNSNLENYDKLLKKLFDQTQEAIFAMPVIVAEAIKVFSQNEDCFKKILAKYHNGEMNNAGLEALIAKLFDKNQTDLGWEILNKTPQKFLPLVIKSYFDFCIRLAENGKFSFDIINDYINFIKKHSIVPKFNNLYEVLVELIDVLNKSEEHYNWSVEKCEVTEKYTCSFCRNKFKHESVTQEELLELKDVFLEKVIICRNVNMKTTPDELMNYLQFLNNCKPYDIVIDMLNLYGGTVQQKESAMNFLSYFERKRMKMLLIAKDHFKKSSIYPVYRKKCQIFLTKNESMDDLFCIFAAMHRGLGTYFCTFDFFRDHAKYFNNFRLKTLFHKWQLSHQYMPLKDSRAMVKPRIHSDISQSTVVPNGEEYFWHLSYLDNNQNYRINTPAKWICLRAKSKTAKVPKERKRFQESKRPLR